MAKSLSPQRTPCQQSSPVAKSPRPTHRLRQRFLSMVAVAAGIAIFTLLQQGIIPTSGFAASLAVSSNTLLRRSLLGDTSQVSTSPALYFSHCQALKANTLLLKGCYLDHSCRMPCVCRGLGSSKSRIGRMAILRYRMRGCAPHKPMLTGQAALESARPSQASQRQALPSSSANLNLDQPSA